MRRTAPAALALAAIAGALLVGCTPEPPAETTPPPTAEPTASEEEALASSAASTYERFLNEKVAMIASGSADAAALEGIATEGYAELVALEVQVTIDQGFVMEGAYAIDDFEVAAREGDRLEANVCIDNSLIQATQDGVALPSQRPDPVRVTFNIASAPLVDLTAPIPDGETFECS